jgi:hypothetical protein
MRVVFGSNMLLSAPLGGALGACLWDLLSLLGGFFLKRREIKPQNTVNLDFLL